MTLNGITRAILALTLCTAGLFGQTVSSSLIGIVVDPKDSPVADAPVTLTNVGTAAVLATTTDGSGVYSFPGILAGTYTVTVKAPGFRAQAQTGIVLHAQETRNTGKMKLQAGSVADLTVLIASPVQLQLGSSGKVSTVDAQTIEDLPLKGRDMFGYLRLNPDVVDTSYSRDVTSSGSLAGIFVAGNSAAINFNVDGATMMDTGTNQNAQVEPNVDSIQEIRLLSANYQAQYGGNAGGVVTVITKSGTQDLHGSGSWNHRNQEFNANSWANNNTLTAAGTATPRSTYQFNVETYSVGGPVYIPKVANVERKKLFFFFSQERTGQLVPAPSQYSYMPTSLERAGNFSQTFTNVNGNAVSIPVLDPANNNTQFPANTIPTSRLSYVGQSLLGFFPTPNFTPTQSTQLDVINYFEGASVKHPRRNDILRLDANVTPTVTAYFRWLDDKDSLAQPFVGAPFQQYTGSTSLTANLSSINHLTPGHGYQGTLTATISPTMVNDFTAGQSWNESGYLTADAYASEDASLEPGLPYLFPIPTATSNGVVSATNGYHSLLPTFTFGGNGLPSSAFYTRNSATAGAADNLNTVWNLQDNITKVFRHHTLKAGFYGERDTRIQPAGQNYSGAYTFAATSSVPFLNTNDGYANAILGDTASYTQYTGTTTSNVLDYTAEFYLQDSWKVNRRLTLDFGVRFYHQTPPTDHDGTFVNFEPSLYKKSAMSRIYYPYCSNSPATCTSAADGLVARDGLTGATVSAAYIGDLVYGSGTPVSGMVELNKTTAPYTQTALAYAPRVGFAYDLFGDGKTAVRGGYGMYHNRLAGNSIFGLAGQEPLVYQQSVSNLTFTQISALNNGAAPVLTNLTIAPATPYAWPSSAPYQKVQNASLDVQHNFRGTFVDLGYTLTQSSDQFLTYDSNYVPIGSSWPFTKSNLNPTTSGNTSADIGSIYERSIYPGYGAVTTAAFLGSSKYNAVTAKATRTISRGLTAALAYTWSKANGVTTYSPEVANNNSYNYGRLATDRRNNLVVNFTYALPDPAAKLGLPSYVGYVTGHWQLSGVISMQSGAPYDPTCSVTNGQAAPASYTGTPDLAVRCNVVGNPLTGTVSTGNGKEFFNAAAFALPALGTGPNNSIVGSAVLGNLGGGAGVLSLPRTTNFDLNLTKVIPLFGSEKRVLKLQVQAYNALNHTEISGINSAIQFNPTTNAVSNPSQVGYINAAFPNRVLEFTARIVF